MDLRDFDFWIVEAKQQRFGRETEMMERMRFAMWAEGKEFSNFIQETRMSLMTPEQKKAMHDQAWLSLRTIGRA
jgi:hypothetical protein